MIGTLELEKLSTYEFILHPSPNFKEGSEIRICSIPELEVDSTCSINISAICTLTACPECPTPLAIITGGLEDPSNLQDISFQVANIRNPILPYLATDLRLHIMSRESGGWIYHESYVNISYPIYYDPHPLQHTCIGWGVDTASDYTVTNTTYRFNLINLDYMIPPGAHIRVIFPTTFLFLTPLPALDDILGILDTAGGSTGLFNYPNFTISGGFGGMLSPDSVIQFKVGYILNPYLLGFTDSFQVFIYTGGDPNLTLFQLNTELKKEITVVANFSSFTVSTNSLVNNAVAIYTFTFTLGAGALNTSHYISVSFLPPADVQQCDPGTISPIFGVPSISYTNSIHVSADTYSYIFGITGLITAHTNCQFTVECRNPFTTRPSEIITIFGTDGTSVFYNSRDYIQTMTTMSELQSFTYTMPNLNPREILTYSFYFQATSPIATHRIDQIEITIPNEMEIEGCMPSDVVGIFGNIQCLIVGQIFTLYNISKLESSFSFKMLSLRNPDLSTQDISFYTVIKHSDGYLGEYKTSGIQQLLCDFPCRKCDPPPNVCDYCFSKNNEVFELSGLNSYMLYYNERICTHLCPTYTYMATPTICHGTYNIYII